MPNDCNTSRQTIPFRGNLVGYLFEKWLGLNHSFNGGINMIRIAYGNTVTGQHALTSKVSYRQLVFDCRLDLS